MSGYPLQHIEIDGFRGFRNFTLPALGGVNVLVGANNSGKTSLLEAISVLCTPAEPGCMIDMIRYRDPGGIDESRLHSLRWCFHRAEAIDNPEELVTAICEMRVESTFGLTQLRITLKEFVGEPAAADLERAKRLGRRFDAEKADYEWKGSDIGFEPTFSVSSEGARSVASPGTIGLMIWDGLPITRFGGTRKTRMPHLKSAVIYPTSYQLNPVQVQSLSRLQSSEGAVFATELLRQFDPDVIDIDIRSNQGYRPAIYLKHQRIGLAPLSVFGDAMRRSMLLASTLSNLPAGSVLLIDEVEAGIHVDAQPRFFAWLMNAAHQRQVQVFMTTHSLEALDAMLMGQPSPTTDGMLVVYQLKRDAENNVDCKRFSGDLLHRLRFERGLDVR
ncbi:MAG: hypothetical protein RLY71_2217 [Pseudomonadota bacterium]|jgi:predicted ATPase